MKRIGLLLLIGLLNMAYANETKVEEVLDGYMKAWAEHNITKIDSYYNQDVIWYDLPSDVTTKGKKEVTKAITDAFMANVPDMYWVKTGDVFVSGNTITYEWTYGGTLMVYGVKRKSKIRNSVSKV